MSNKEFILAGREEYYVITEEGWKYFDNVILTMLEEQPETLKALCETLGGDLQKILLDIEKRRGIGGDPPKNGPYR